MQSETGGKTDDPRSLKIRFFEAHARGKFRAGLTEDQVVTELQSSRKLICSLESDPQGFVTDQELREIARQACDPSELTEAGDPDARWLRHYPSNQKNLIRGTADYILDTSWRPQPGFALFAAIALTAVILGRRVRDEFDTRTNLYSVCVGPSGCGKDRPRQAIKQILTLSGAEALIGPDGINSGEGLITTLNSRPALLLCLDEFGKLMEAASDDRQSWMRKVVAYLLTAYSSPNQIWLPNAFAEEKKNKSIAQPNPVIFGTTVPQSLNNSLTRESLSDGLVSRLLIVQTETVPPKRRPEVTDPPAWIIEDVKRWIRFQPGDGNLRNVHPQPLIVPASDDAKAHLASFDDECEAKANKLAEEAGASVWRRASESVSKLALIHACAERFDSPRIELDSVEWASVLVADITEQLLETCRFWIGENQHERDVNLVLRVIRDAGPAGIARRALTRRTQKLRKRDREEMIHDLIESGRIVLQGMQTTGRTADVFKLVE